MYISIETVTRWAGMCYIIITLVKGGGDLFKISLLLSEDEVLETFLRLFATVNFSLLYDMLTSSLNGVYGSRLRLYPNRGSWWQEDTFNHWGLQEFFASLFDGVLIFPYVSMLIIDRFSIVNNTGD